MNNISKLFNQTLDGWLSFFSAMECLSNSLEIITVPTVHLVT